MDRRAFLIAGVAGLAAPAAAQTPTLPWTPPSDQAIRALLARRVDDERQSVGIVVGIVDRKGRRIVSHGRMAANGAPVDGRTLFEIGSVTKVFTSLVLADMAARGEVGLDDPVARYLPAGVKVPERGRAITLMDLATHTSGLPRLPANLPMTNPADPYADYTVDQLYAFLRDYALPREVGAQFEYSNLGAGLLGHVLARRAGMDYESLIRARITDPLRMKDTGIAVPASLNSRFATGHDRFLSPAAHWTLPTLAGAGALHSTADDLLSFLEAEIGLRETPLSVAMAAQLVPRRPAGPNEIALGWMTQKRPGGEAFWHNGGTGGYRAFCGFDRQAGFGVVALSNAFTEVGMDDIGGHLLWGAAVRAFQPPPQAIPLDLAAAARWVGVYEAAPGARMTLTLEGGRLLAQLTGQPKTEVFQSGPSAFFW
jgi:CubicO group peptidase (beta-lactamase class C family)